jgi:hypothetical protein
VRTLLLITVHKFVGKMQPDRSGSNFKIDEFLNLNLIFLKNKNIKKIRKKIDEILRPLVKNFF